jgi:hypothetical protein
METIKLKLRQTSDHYFRATLDHREEQEGFLPPMPPELAESLKNWQSTYRQLEDVRSYIAPKPGLRSSTSTVSDQCSSDYRLTPKRVTYHNNSSYADDVKIYLNQWLNTQDSHWSSIREAFILIASQSHRDQDQPLILLDVHDIKLCRLPWQEWNLFETCDLQAEIALRVKGQPGDDIKPPRRLRKVRILVVVGRSDGIRTEDDLKVIQKLEAKGAEVVTLIQPTVRDLCEALWDKEGYHIFVFTGHSGSQDDGQIGWIEVNEKDSLSIEEFKHALKAAIDRGLQLAIFNSCDGLGLANQLAKLNLPRSIVMREPVPDQVAIEFLTHFFAAFTDDHSLFASIHKARKQLEHFSIPQETKTFYPGVMWLPVLCIRQSALNQTLTWKGLIRPSLPVFSPTVTHALSVFAGMAIALTGLMTVQLSHLLPQPSSSPIASSPISVPEGNWRSGGSTTWAPLRSQIYKWIQQTHPTF